MYAIHIAKKRDTTSHFNTHQEDGSGSVASNQEPPSVVSAPARWAGVHLQRIKGVQLFIAGDMKQILCLTMKQQVSLPMRVMCMTSQKPKKIDLETNGETLTTNK